MKYVLVEEVNDQKNREPSWPWCGPQSRREQTLTRWPATPKAMMAPQARALLGRAGMSSRGAAPTVGRVTQPLSLEGVVQA